MSRNDDNRFHTFIFTGNDDHTLYMGVKDGMTGVYYHTVDRETAEGLTDLLNELYDELVDYKKIREVLKKTYR